MTKILGALALVLISVTVGSIPAQATSQFSSVGCDGAECLETWQFTCGASKTALARVRDTVGTDDVLLVTVIATAPSLFKGQADSQFAAPGFFSDFAFLGNFFGKATTLSGFAIVSNLSGGGANYELEIVCEEIDGPLHDPSVFKRLQNQ